MNWRPKHGDVVVIRGVQRRVIGELHDRPIIDEPGNPLESHALDAQRYLMINAGRAAGKSAFATAMGHEGQNIWNDWNYDLLGSVRARLEKKA
jgi:hypothetical protein